MEEKRKIYHWLHNSAAGCAEAKRQDELLVFRLQNMPGRPKGEKEYLIRVDPREQRTIVAFEGHIPWGGLPKNGSVIVPVSDSGVWETSVTVPIQSIRKVKAWEEPPTDCYIVQEKYCHLFIARYFLLLPKSVSCVRRYDNKSLRPIYTFIEINEKGVTWRTSSY